MDSLRPLLAAEAEIEVAFLTTRGANQKPSIFIGGLAALKLAFDSVVRRVDLIHVNLGARGSCYRKMALIAVPRLARVPYVLHLHGSGFDTFWRGAPPLIRLRIDKLFSNAAAIIVLGEKWRALILERLPDLDSKITILANASRPVERRHHLCDGEVRLLFLGELGDRKGSPILLKALSRLKTTTPWQAVIAGDGVTNSAQADAERLGISDKVQLPGWVNADAVEALLSKSDILVLPSREENLPMSVVEAFAAGLAVVATPVGALPDILKSGETGLFVEPGDVEALAQTLKALIDDPVYRQRLGAAAKAYHADHLTLDSYASRLVSAWRNAPR